MMGNSKHGHVAPEHDAEDHAQDETGAADAVDAAELEREERNSTVATVATVGVVGLGVIIFEAALLPGVILGAAAVLAPKFMPKMESSLNPLFKSTVRGIYKMGRKTREVVAETQERMHDIVAEVNAETDAKPAPSNSGSEDKAMPNAA